MNGQDDLIKDFLVQSYEDLDQLDRDLVELESTPDSEEHITRVFRVFHTIKGSCGFLGLKRLEALTHTTEHLLSALRDGSRQVDPELITLLLEVTDGVRNILKLVESSGSDADAEIESLTAKIEASKGSLESPEPVADADVPAEQSQDAAAASAEDSAAKPATAAQQKPKVSDSAIRVEVDLLDRLMNQVGELVLARNQILQRAAASKDATFVAACQRLNLITTELQSGVMKTRMQPIRQIWGKFPRIVREVAAACQKDVRIELDGAETELDKTIIEAINDPLTHIVRNAIDHGIETPQERLAVGKPREGCVFLRAYHESGQVNIEISDDGRGINAREIRQQATKLGLIDPAQADRLGDRELANLIFLPGFSTAQTVTNVSGRGVGMDVVRSHIEKIGGTVDVESKPEVGTTFKVKIPLTLAIIPALIVTCGSERFAIPQVSLLELVRLEGTDGQVGVERIHNTPVYRLRGNLLPLVYLDRELGTDEESARRGDVVNIVVLQAGDRQFGLVVSEINDTEEIVVKPLGKELTRVTCFAGATIMGDGKVALILDVLGIAQSAEVISDVQERGLLDKAVESAGQEGTAQTLLLFQIGANRMAIPLNMVARLEEFRRDQVERGGSRSVVQYRNHLLPLLNLSEVLGYESEDKSDSLHVVVYTENERSVGLVVDRIIDIVTQHVELQAATQEKGILGSAIIQGRVTDLVDLPGILNEADPNFYQPAITVAAGD